MISELGVWFIFLLPLASFAVIGLVVRPVFGKDTLWAGRITTGAVAVSFVLANLIVDILYGFLDPRIRYT